MAVVGDLNVQVGLQLEKLESGFRELQGKFRSNNAALRRESRRTAEGMGDEFNRVLKRKFGAGDVFKGVLQGIGIGSVEHVVEMITSPWKEAAKYAEDLAAASERSVEAQAKLFDARNARRPIADQIKIAKEEGEKLQRAFDTQLGKNLLDRALNLNPIKRGDEAGQIEAEKIRTQQTEVRAKLEELQARQAEEQKKSAEEIAKKKTKDAQDLAKLREKQADEELARAHRGAEANQKEYEKTEKLRRDLATETAHVLKSREEEAMAAARKAIADLKLSLLSLKDIGDMGGGSENARHARAAQDLRQQAQEAEASGDYQRADHLRARSETEGAKVKRRDMVDDGNGNLRPATAKEIAAKNMEAEYERDRTQGNKMMPAEAEAARNLQEQGKVLAGMQTLIGTLNALPAQLGIA